MPKETFHNLSETKKQKIFVAAVQEFSTRRFSEASINQIIKHAEIPRGSFYQYFTGKEDIFLYMLEQILKEKWEIITQAGAYDPEADVFENCIQATRASFEWGRAKPEYNQYNQINMLMETDNSNFITKLRTASAQGVLEIVERDKQRGLIKPEVDSHLVVDMIYTLISREFFRTGSDEELFLKRITDVMQIIKKGITT